MEPKAAAPTRTAGNNIPALSEDPLRIVPLAAAIAAISVVGIAIGLGIPLLSFLLESRGFSAGEIGLNTAAAGFASIAAAPFATPIAARFGVVRTMVAMLALAGASFAGFYVADGFWSWFALRIGLHFALTVLFILSEFWINHSAPPRRRGMVLGVYATVLSLGFALGPSIFAQVGSQGFAPFAIALALISAAAIPVLAAWRNSPDLGGDGGDGHLGFARHLVSVPTATAAVFVFGAVETGGFALLPVYGLRIGFNEADSAMLLTMIGLGNVVLQIPLGYLSDHLGDRRRLLVGCAAAGFAGMLALPYLSASWLAMAILLFIWGGVVAGLYTVGLAHLGAQLRGRDLASANAAFVFCYSLGMLAGPWSIGAGMDIAGPQGFAHVLAIFFAAYLVLVIFRTVAIPRGHRAVCPPGRTRDASDD